VNWLEDIAAELPAPRDDEPADLRRRIVAEIADHLQLAFVRELHFVRDETKAREKVLARFGDPRRIARKLWFEAMREKIMSQRLLVASSAITTALCLAMGLFLWRISAQSAEASRALIQETREMNLALIEKLASIASPGAPAQPADMVHLTFRLVQNSVDGPPAAGYSVRMERPRTDSPDYGISKFEDNTGPDGTIDCGLVRYGNFHVRVTTPWGELTWLDVYVRAGRSEQLETIVCPDRGPPETEASFGLQLPDDLRERDLRLVVQIRPAARQVHGLNWRDETDRYAIVGADGVPHRFKQMRQKSNHGFFSLYRLEDLQENNMSLPTRFDVFVTAVAMFGDALAWPKDGSIPVHGLSNAERTADRTVDLEPGGPNRVVLPLERIWDLVRKNVDRPDDEGAPGADEDN
jgi:hypothetical protein